MLKMKQETLVKSKGRYAKKHYKREIIASILYCLISYLFLAELQI